PFCSSFVVVATIGRRHGAEYMSDQHRVSVEEAHEARADIDSVWFDADPTSRSGRSIHVIAYSHTRRAALTIILVHRAEDGRFWGANGWKSSVSDRRRYERGE